MIFHDEMIPSYDITMAKSVIAVTVEALVLAFCDCGSTAITTKR